MPDSNFTQSDTDQLAQSQPLQTQPQDTPQAPAPPIPTNGAGVNAVAGMPTATPTQAPTPTVKPHPVADMFNKILTSAVGGPMSTVDENGVRRPAPQSNVSLGKILTASLLAGIFSKDEYRQTAYGPVRDYSGTAGNAAAASQKVIQSAQARPQQQFDEQKARQQAGRLLTLENNSKLVALQTASANLKHSYQTQNAAAVETALGPFKEYESSRTADQPKAWIDGGQNLTHVQAMDMIKQKGNGYTENNILQDGWTSKWNDATKQSEPEPTYGILSSELKDIKLSDEATQLLARVHSQWANAQKVTDGNVRVPVNVYVSALHDVQAVMQGAETLNQLSQELGGKGVTQSDVEAAARAGRDKGANILPALYNLSHAVAGGNLPDQRADNLLHTLMTAPNGGDILKLIGLTPEQASEKAEAINNERIRKAELAKSGGIGDKAMAPPQMVNAVVAAAKKLPAEYQATILSGVNPNGMTVGELEKLKDNVRDTQKHVDDLEQKNLTRGGDPVVQSKTANNLIEGDVARLDKITSVRGNARQELMDTIHDEAQRRGLDTTQFSPAALENKSTTWNDYNGNKKGSTGSQIASFNAFLGHTAGAVDAEKRLEGKTLGLTRSPWVNTAMDSLGKQVTDDPDWKAYKTSLLPVQNEISNFLAAGYAVKAEDAALMQQVTDPHETPARVTAALRQLAETADIRLQAIGQRYLDTMGTTYPTLMSSDSMNTLKRLGIESKALPLSQRLPRGWQNNQPQQMTDRNMAVAYVKAAGNDRAKAQELAKANGWILN